MEGRGFFRCILSVSVNHSPGRDFKDLAWDNYLLRLRGRETVISTMDGLWTGYWARWLPCSLAILMELVTRDQRLGAKELFLYSKSDFYLPYK